MTALNPNCMTDDPNQSFLNFQCNTKELLTYKKISFSIAQKEIPKLLGAIHASLAPSPWKRLCYHIRAVLKKGCRLEKSQTSKSSHKTDTTECGPCPSTWCKRRKHQYWIWIVRWHHQTQLTRPPKKIYQWLSLRSTTVSINYQMPPTWCNLLIKTSIP